MNKKVIVIGSGIAGIAVSIRLRSLGYQVLVLEKNAYPGGKLTAFSDKGYRFDAGPSLFTLPYLVTELFELTGQKSKMFDYHEIPVACNYFFHDRTSFIAYADKTRLEQEVERVFGKKARSQVVDYLDRMKTWYELTAPLFLEKSLHTLSGWLNKATLKGVLGSFKLPLLSSMNRYNQRQFSDERLVQLFNRYATYNGSNPYVAPGLMCMISHLEHNLGTYLPVEGMHQINQSLVALSKAIGVEYQFNSLVEEVVVASGVAKGVNVSTGIKGTVDFLDADLVVSDSDVYPLYEKLLPNYDIPRSLSKQEPSSSALIFYWGISHCFEQLDLHNIFFSSDYEAEFKEIFENGNVSDDPTVYVNISSKYVASDAPEGKENWFVMINVPANVNQDWSEIIERVREIVLRKLEKHLGVPVATFIETEEVLDPISIESKTSSRGGALYGSSSNSRMSAFLRHPNFHPEIKGLYCCGGSVHPGGGIPLCLLSAKIVEDLITKDHAQV